MLKVSMKFTQKSLNWFEISISFWTADGPGEKPVLAGWSM
jgi:hypothetical protein